MTNSFEERISGLVDGELHDADRADAIDTLLHNDSARQCWERYHLISDAMKRNLPAAMDKGFANSVMAALKDEPTVLAPPRREVSTFTKRVAGLAVAASVAAIGVLGVQFMYQEDGLVTAPDQIAQLQPSQSSAGNPALQSSVQLVSQEAIPLTSRRIPPNLNRYLLDHSQQTAGVQGIVPYARIVTYPASGNVQR